VHADLRETQERVSRKDDRRHANPHARRASARERPGGGGDRCLADDHTCAEIARLLNARGLRTSRGQQPFDGDRVDYLDDSNPGLAPARRLTADAAILRFRTAAASAPSMRPCRRRTRPSSCASHSVSRMSHSRKSSRLVSRTTSSLVTGPETDERVIAPHAGERRQRGAAPVLIIATGAASGHLTRSILEGRSRTVVSHRTLGRQAGPNRRK
jgi:hypothetical protein